MLRSFIAFDSGYRNRCSGIYFKMKNKYIWLICGIMLILSILMTTVHFNLVINDMRNITSKMTIEDFRTVIKIIENQQEIKLNEK